MPHCLASQRACLPKGHQLTQTKKRCLLELQASPPSLSVVAASPERNGAPRYGGQSAYAASWLIFAFRNFNSNSIGLT